MNSDLLDFLLDIDSIVKEQLFSRMDYISYVFALLVMTGGVMGFLKAGEWLWYA